MLYLALNVILSSFFVLCVKWVQGRREDVISVGAVNYIVAAIVAAAFYWRAPTPTSGAIWTGTINGLCYFSAFFFLIVAVSFRGAANVAAVTRLSILMPIAIGIIWLQERPSLMQGLGIALACSSLSLIGRAPPTPLELRERSSAGTQGLLALAFLFLISGGSRVAQGLFKHTSTPDQHITFLFYLFLVSAVGSVVVLCWRRRRIVVGELLIGTALGLTNLLQTFFVLKALEHLPGYVVFPVTSAGGLAFTTLIAICFLNERLSPRNYLGIGVAVASLVLLRNE